MRDRDERLREVVDCPEGVVRVDGWRRGGKTEADLERREKSAEESMKGNPVSWKMAERQENEMRNGIPTREGGGCSVG